MITLEHNLPIGISIENIRTDLDEITKACSYISFYENKIVEDNYDSVLVLKSKTQLSLQEAYYLGGIISKAINVALLIR